MSKTTELGAGAFLDGFRLTAALLINHPQLPLPASVEIDRCGYDIHHDHDQLRVAIQLPDVDDEQAAEKQQGAWIAALGLEETPPTSSTYPTSRVTRYFAKGLSEGVPIWVCTAARTSLPEFEEPVVLAEKAPGPAPIVVSLRPATVDLDRVVAEPDLVVGSPPGPASAAELALRLAYWALPKKAPGEWVSLAALRAAVGFDRFTRAEVDQGLADIAASQDGHLLAVLGPASEAPDWYAVLTLGGEPYHALMIEERVPATAVAE